ncbi:MAG: type II toxin-antitoxin system RelE/ParE family toxin [Rickettsiales bacterium]
MQTIIEFGDFYKNSLKLLGADGHEELVSFIACNPKAGDIIQGTGGFRKLRFKRSGIGKSGGARIIYFFYTPNKPIMLFMIYAKNEMDNLTSSQKNWLNKQSKILKGD